MAVKKWSFVYKRFFIVFLAAIQLSMLNKQFFYFECPTLYCVVNCSKLIFLVVNRLIQTINLFLSELRSKWTQIKDDCTELTLYFPLDSGFAATVNIYFFLCQIIKKIILFLRPGKLGMGKVPLTHVNLSKWTEISLITKKLIDNFTKFFCIFINLNLRLNKLP